MAETRGGFKLLVPHSATCFFRDTDEPQFVLHAGMEWDRKRNGAARGSSGFHRFRCNCPDCPAILLVRFDVLCDWLGRDGAAEGER